MLLHTFLTGYTLSYICIEGYLVQSGVGFLGCCVVLLFCGIVAFVWKIVAEILKPEYDPSSQYGRNNPKIKQ